MKAIELLKCDACNEVIVKAYEGELKMRSKLLLWNKRGCYAVCKGCGKEIAIEPEILRKAMVQFVYEITQKGVDTEGKGS